MQKYNLKARLPIDADSLSIGQRFSHFADFPVWMIQSLDREAMRLGVPRQSVMNVWIAERLAEKHTLEIRGFEHVHQAGQTPSVIFYGMQGVRA